MTATMSNKANCQAQRDNTKVATSGSTAPAAAASAAAASQAPGTSSGCPASGTKPAATNQLSPPASAKVAGGKATIAIPITALADDKLTITLGNVTANQVSQVVVLGKPATKGVSVVVAKPSGDLPANSNVTFVLQGVTAGATVTVTWSGASGTSPPATVKLTD
jgi:hypothetical protein